MSTGFDPLDHPRDAIGRFDTKTGTSQVGELGAVTGQQRWTPSDKVAQSLGRLTDLGEQARHLRMRHRLAPAMGEAKAAGITSVTLAPWADGDGCRVDSYTTEHEEFDLLGGAADAFKPGHQAVLERLENLASAAEIAHAIGGSMGAEVRLETDGPYGLADIDRLGEETTNLFERDLLDALPSSVPQPGHKAQWCVEQARKALRFGTDLRDDTDIADLDIAVGDALANLRHLCTARGLDFDDALIRSADYVQSDVESDALGE